MFRSDVLKERERGRVLPVLCHGQARRVKASGVHVLFVVLLFAVLMGQTTVAEAREVPPFAWWYSPVPAPVKGSAALSRSSWDDEGRTDEILAFVRKNALPESGEFPLHYSSLLDRRPLRSFYLIPGKDTDIPEEAPEFYYRFTSRELSRGGGAVTGVHVRRVFPVWDRGTWRVDIDEPSFGTVEIFSRFRTGGRTVYSQSGYMHFIFTDKRKHEASEGGSDAAFPEDWPVLKLEHDGDNVSVTRVRSGRQVFFRVDTAGRHAEPGNAFFCEGGNEVRTAKALGNGDFTWTPMVDRELEEAPNMLVKTAAVVVELPGSDECVVMTMELGKSSGAGRNLGAGLALCFGSALLTGLCVKCGRRRFAYHDRY